MSDDSHTYPWDAEHWPGCLAAFKEVPLFIVTTPVYVFWPLDSATCRKTIKRWTSLLPSDSAFQVEINSGYCDEGERAREYETDNECLVFDTDYGVKFSIASHKGKWTIMPCCTHHDECHYYFFHTWGHDINATWMHEEDVANCERAPSGRHLLLI